MGRRIAEISDGLPKSMIKFGDETILHYQIRNCLECGINEFTIVLGYRFDFIKEHVLEILKPSQVNFVKNDIFDHTNTLYSLWLAKDFFKESFIYFNADVIFHPQLLKKITTENGRSELLLETKKCGEEEVKMIIDTENTILQIGKKLPVDECAGEFVGIGKFDKSVLKTFKNKLNLGVEQGQENNYFEYAVDLMAQEEKLHAVSTEDLPCIEIDFPEDLRKAKEEVFPSIK